MHFNFKFHFSWCLGAGCFSPVLLLFICSILLFLFGRVDAWLQKPFSSHYKDKQMSGNGMGNIHPEMNMPGQQNRCERKRGGEGGVGEDREKKCTFIPSVRTQHAHYSVACIFREYCFRMCVYTWNTIRCIATRVEKYGKQNIISTL